MQFALPILVLSRQLECDICFFIWDVFERIILSYSLIRESEQCVGDTVKLVIFDS